MMVSAEQKIVRYLNEAHATEAGLMRQLQGQIAMTPEGSYRAALERHLEETRDHAERVQRRLGELGEATNPFLAGVGMAESLMAQWLAVAKMPFELARGTGGEEKILKNAKDSAASEALEIATYIAIEHAARAVGDEQTATLAASIRGDEERMLATLLDELPRLAEAVVRAEVQGERSFDLTTTGAAQAAQQATRAARRTAQRGAETARETAPARARSTRRTAKKTAQPAGATTRRSATRGRATTARSTAPAAPEAATPAEPATAGARAAVTAPAASELPIARYDALTADEVTERLRSLSQQDLATVEAYERANQGRQTVLERIGGLREDEPWPGYDAQTVEQIRQALNDADPEHAKAVRDYERRHQDRTGVIQATESRPSTT
jgi:ferritin-like metal-binding protein YciE